MKKLILILIIFATLVQPIEAQMTREDMRRTVEQIQRLSREQQSELTLAKTENERVKSELKVTQEFHAFAQSQADALQKEVVQVTEDRNKQAVEKDKAITEKTYWKTKHEEAVSKLWGYRIKCWGAFGIAGILGVLIVLFKFTSLGSKFIKPL